MPSWPRSSTLVKPTTCAAASPSGYLRLYSRTSWMPLMPSAFTCAATLSSTWRRSQTKFGLSSSRRSSSALVMSSRRREPGAAGGVAFQVLRDRPDRRRRHARRQDQAVAVDDPAAARRQLERVAVADLALLQEERRVEDLHVDGAAEQHREAEADQRHQQLRAPGRRRRRQQRAGRVVDAARARGRARASRAGLRFIAVVPEAAGGGAGAAPAARRTGSPPASRRASPGGRARCARRAAASPASAARSSAARCRCRARAPRSAPCRARRTGAATRTRRAPGRGCSPAAPPAGARLRRVTLPPPAPSGSAVRSATRITAERARGLARRLGRTRLDAGDRAQPVRLRRGEGRAPVELGPALAWR